MQNVQTEQTAAEKIAACTQELGLTVSAIFVPWSQSRNKAEKQPSLNWVVSIERNGKRLLSTAYSAGMGHCPAYKASVRRLGNQNSVMRHEAIKYECERGRQAFVMEGIGHISGGSKPLEPSTCDVIASLVLDSSVLDESSFEDWASSLGYDTDSRAAEKIYQDCLRIALQLRNGLGESGLKKLRQACQDY